jgi:hypothetical protein
MTYFTYHTLKELPPRPGRKFATTYYQQNLQEHQRVVEYCQGVIARCLEEFSARGTLDIIHEALPGFPRTGSQPNYSFWDIVSDLNDYLVRGHDIPSGMLGRWNRLFELNPDFQIQLETPEQARLRQQQSFHELFTTS